MVTDSSTDRGVPDRLLDIVKGVPETSIGRGVSARGNLTFERLLCVWGSFTGTLKSKGSVVIKKGGEFKGSLTRANMVVIEGKVVGDIKADEVRGACCVLVFFCSCMSIGMLCGTLFP